MPVVTTSVVSYVLMKLSINMEDLTAYAAIRKYLDGVASGDVEFHIKEDELVPLLSSTPDNTKTRGADVTDIVYALAISKGLIAGTIS